MKKGLFSIILLLLFGFNDAIGQTSGNVGIGTTNPRSAFNVANGGMAIGSGSGISTIHGIKRSFQILTDTYYGGIYDNHSGFLIYTTMPTGWGSAILNFAVSTGWGIYNTSNPTLSLRGTRVGIGTTDPAASAALDISSTERGLLIPRLSQQQIWSLQNPADGLQVYCTTDGKLYIYVSAASQWKEVAYGAGTLTPGTCGYTITKSHVAGNVAPVNKTTTYGTANGVPGEPTKCWITSNLGSDQQATAVDDASEASAGWYWQFNRKQGYKHDGTTLTPAWTITSISENSDWLAANDPCTIELGTYWRIPTYTEWYNVDVSGGWTDWNGPWNSLLKLHAAGFLHYSDGSLISRGLGGVYWSSTQFNDSLGWRLVFIYSSCAMSGYDKAHGYTLRCLRDF